MGSVNLSSKQEHDLQKIVDDLSSDDAFVRRSAREELTKFLNSSPTDQAATVTSRLLQNLSLKSYRFQLGLAIALARLSGEASVENPSAARQELDRALNAPAARDSTLKNELNKARNKMPRL